MNQTKSTLPQLPISLREHKWAILFNWTLLVLTACILPIALFYALWFGTSLKPQIGMSWSLRLSLLFFFFSRTLLTTWRRAELTKLAVFAIPSAIFGGFTLLQMIIRVAKLARPNPNYRPIDSPRAALDFFQWGFFIGFSIVTVEIAVGTALKQPLIRLLAMPGASLMFEVALLILMCDLLVAMGRNVPFRTSSVRKGDRARPGIYVIIEDIVAVDGGAGLPYRTALDARYKASSQFRAMLFRLSMFWSISLLVFGGAITAIVWTVPQYVAYGLGWGLPFVHAAIMAVITVKYVQACLARESLTWASQEGTTL